ncbi:RidA family protein [Paraburkholderia youngii]|uniref:2-iminobutanoate/2-iminopropanoate deaminase n=1 Tax=Paraburkholderia youngii TaxID=2782701 RepID=A0A7W8P4I4_9BURK|nr:RidA family protein [Paraburkholderia youngii]MBB5402090.1 2-iminobutanoate/2-iminopropanoate deaminase [Paraburkholderia youngii]
MKCEGKRSIEVPGVTHGQTPIPMGARKGNFIFSSGIAGKDPQTDTLPEDAQSQAKFAFQNMRTLVEAGGGTVNDIVRVTVFLKDGSLRPIVNPPWLEMFPDPEDRPARHAQIVDLPGGMQIQLEVIAVLGD